ncbi:MAG: hypothetical protein UR26_C0002G0100 [candidate division TM6 bacterium GW2011_GWF2_32_72]|nr:MAG: hypothetical protein UR26_C0002G0100 [candidate division TM6 bacterium GW2011_GWF2_32_72]
MNIPNFFQEIYVQHFYFVGWRDIIEISFFSSLFYYFSLWLKKDKSHNLLPAFYGYFCIAIAAYTINLSAISSFMFLFSPVTIMLFILMHQRLLQQNFVSLTKIKPAKTVKSDWVGQLLASSLSAINDEQEITFLLEKTYPLEELVKTNFRLNAEFEKDLVGLLINNSNFEPKKMIWLSCKGKLLAINTEWSTSIDEQWITEEAKELHKWKQDALFFTKQTDCLILKTNPKNRSFSIISEGVLLENINASGTIKILKRFLAVQDSTQKREVIKNEKQNSQQLDA